MLLRVSLFQQGRRAFVSCSLSFFERRCIYPGEQMLLAPFLETISLDRASGRYADFLIAPRQVAAGVSTSSCPVWRVAKE